MLRISIDGACRRNGQPDCISAGGIFVQHFDEDGQVLQTVIQSNFEHKSTNQRGELLALLKALDYIWEAQMDAHIVTDSEYLFKTMTKDWLYTWEKKGWINALNEPVKNIDLLQEVLRMYNACTEFGIEIVFYHIKGHVIPFGKVTARKLLESDITGIALYEAIQKKLATIVDTFGIPALALELSEKNNGQLPESILKEFIVTNLIADAAATKCVEAADSKRKMVLQPLSSKV